MGEHTGKLLPGKLCIQVFFFLSFFFQRALCGREITARILSSRHPSRAMRKTLNLDVSIRLIFLSISQQREIIMILTGMAARIPGVADV